ncbi:right-handed parallel beta-helix repeat-containing protein [Massilia consociata]|uniref:Right-handed parallel beta-helix repeat-containing protein n=1 Tax=Massilia consociata TaxID=760117 RepID=A0ABV6FBM7_9BURK
MKARLLRYGALLALLGLAAAAGGVFYLQAQGVTPRALAPYIEKRSSGHHPVITGTGQWLGATLRGLDRGEVRQYALPALAAGAQPEPAGDPAAGNVRRVGSLDELRSAMASAVSGDIITLAPGVYRVRSPLTSTRAGVAKVPITVRAERPGEVVFDIEAREGFVVSTPHWTFENLVIRGACAQQGYCDHAFHVVGKGEHFVARNNTITDFNAHFKINGNRNGFPDHGLIEGNTLTNSAVRKTTAAVTPVDLVAASDWIIRGNLITDFVKVVGDRVSYGAFAKGAGARTLFERNVVLCEQKLQGHPGQRVGLSFGGGGTGKPYCRDGKCITEHDQGVMRANLVAACSDVGIYVNSSAGSRIVDNTLLDTAGVDVRFPESSAQVDGNLVDGPVRSRNGGQLRMGDNLTTSIAALYVGLHPQRSLFVSPARLDLRWDGEPPRRTIQGTQDAPLDACGARRPATPVYGAFEDFAACLAPQPRPAAYANTPATRTGSS